MTPALATSTSTGPPKISSASVKASSTEAESVTSQRDAPAGPLGLPGPVRDDDVVAGVREGTGDGQADPSVASGHEHVARLVSATWSLLTCSTVMPRPLPARAVART